MRAEANILLPVNCILLQEPNKSNTGRIGDRTTLDISQRKKKTIPAGWNFFWRSQMTPNQYF